MDYRAARGLDRALFQKLAEGQMDRRSRTILALVGPSGVGKSWLACAIGQKACRDMIFFVNHRWPKFCEELALARGDGRHPQPVKSSAAPICSDSRRLRLSNPSTGRPPPSPPNPRRALWPRIDDRHLSASRVGMA